MKYIDEFRNRELADSMAAVIRQEAQPNRHYRFMEFCGGHTHAIFRYGVQDRLPPNVEFVHGPGCPVCVLPVRRLDDALELASHHKVILCTYGDMMRVPGSGQQSLLKARAAGADVRMVYSIRDALQIARHNPQQEVVFFAIGFETTTPPTAVAITQAEQEGLSNFSVFCNHVLTPPAISHLLESGTVAIDGFLGPSHVSTIIGANAYQHAATLYQKPVVIAGFEPLDVMQSVLMLLRQVNKGCYTVENQYQRAVTNAGNLKAQALVEQVFSLRPKFEWRGLGNVANSALAIRDRYRALDAEKRYTLSKKTSREVKSCECPAVLRGEKKPVECRLFGKQCTPDTPLGACMVSSEGACAAYWSYGGIRLQTAQ